MENYWEGVCLLAGGRNLDPCDSKAVNEHRFFLGDRWAQAGDSKAVNEHIVF